MTDAKPTGKYFVAEPKRKLGLINSNFMSLSLKLFLFFGHVWRIERSLLPEAIGTLPIFSGFSFSHIFAIRLRHVAMHKNASLFSEYMETAIRLAY
jgi:hypothetical protein